MRRVAITGLGAVSPLGLTADATYANACAGACAIGPLRISDRDQISHMLRQPIAAQITDFVPVAGADDRLAEFYDRASQFCMAAAREAVADSGLEFGSGMDSHLAHRTAVVTGTGCGGVNTTEDGLFRIYFEGRPRVHPLTVPRLMPSATASNISIAFGLTGPSFTITSACASAAHAIGEAWTMIRTGRADAALAGGCEAPITFGSIIAWQGLRVMSSKACRPFSARRDGMVLGEGAGIVVLEDMEGARARGARIYGELSGYGLSADAASMVEPSLEGCASAIRQCLGGMGPGADRIGYINAHGTGTLANDETEARALRAVFGDGLDRIWVSATKSMHGHALGASPAIELVLAIRAMSDRVLPPTIGLDDPDPACALRHVRNEAVEADVGAVMSNSFAFGGLNAVLAVQRAD
jgi:nodulation protein E